MPPASRFSARNFTRDHTRQLRNLDAAWSEARQQETTAANAVAGVTELEASARATLADAEARAATAATECEAAKTAQRSLRLAIDPVRRAKTQAARVVDKVNPLLSAAHEAAYLFLAAWSAIEELDAHVARRQAKNDSIPPVLLSEIAAVRNQADMALALLTTALNDAMTAAAVARRAAAASAQTLQVAENLPLVLEPDAERTPGVDSAYCAGSPLQLLIDLAAQVRRQDPGVLPVFSARVTIARRHLEEKKAAAMQAEQALEEAKFGYSRASACTLSAAAALAAARAAVA